DLTLEAFTILREHFFDQNGVPRPFPLRDKRNTQDSPLDEYICNVLSSHLQDSECVPSSGPLISPDLVLLRPDRCNSVSRAALRGDLTRIVGVEIKKLERTESGSVARRSGLDYNTTPPCGTIRVYDVNDSPLDIRGFYLFVCQEQQPGEENTYRLSALALCDGNVLNEDFDLYLAAVGQREKEIGLGTYEDGVNRNRPMFIFANPLGIPELDRAATLIHPTPAFTESEDGVRLAHRLIRMAKDGERIFYCYRVAADVSTSHTITDLKNSIPTPSSRSIRTQSRGRFRLPIEPVP
ncbi:MAG: hypothetical protein ACE5F6_09220, partial [Anaerolineae bacterium]